MTIMLRYRDQVVGVFVLAGIVLLASALLYVGVNKRWFKRDPLYHTTFLTAEGLKTGMGLQLRGFTIGHVKGLSLERDDHGDRVAVTLSVHQEYADRIVDGSVVELAVQPLGFGASLVLYPGRTGGAALSAGAVIPSTDTVEGLALLARGEVDRPQRRDAVASLLGLLPSLVTEAEQLVTTLQTMLARLDTRLMGTADMPSGGLLQTVDTTAREFGDLAAAVNGRTEDLGRILTDLEALTARLADPEGLIPTLLGDEGSAAMLFRDQAALYERLSAAMDELVALTGFMNRSAPEIGLLLEETIRTLGESEKVLQGLKNNPLLRGGIPPESEAPGTFEGRRTLE